MTKLDISISSIKYTIDCSDEEKKMFEDLVRILNIRANELMLKIGKINDKFILFVLLLISQNKKERLFENFEENMIILLKQLKSVLNVVQNNDLEGQLILSNIIKENETKNLPPETHIERVSPEEKMLQLMDRIIVELEKLL